MGQVYNIDKFSYNKQDIDFMWVFFDNGDYVSLSGKEVVSISITTYDMLVKHHRGVSPVVASGKIVLNLQNKITYNYSDSCVYNPKELKRARKEYIENRCLKESKITKIYLFDNNNWHKVLLGNIKVNKVDKHLIFEYVPQEHMGGFDSTEHFVNLGDINPKNIWSIDIDFENCEGFTVYQDEIKEINVEYSPTLQWGSGDIYREIDGGYIRIKLNKDYEPRQHSLFNDDKRVKFSDFEKRLCGKSGEGVHDICHLYVTYNSPGFGEHLEECMEIYELVDEEKVCDGVVCHYIHSNCDDKCDCDDWELYEYKGGYCKKLKDGSVVIAFGKNAETKAKKFK